MGANMRMWALSCSLIACGVLCTSAVYGQAAGDQESTVVTVRGRVLNKITNEPIARALVTTAGDEYATLTNDRGQFAVNIAGPPGPTNGSESRLDAVSRIVGAGMFQARKPGFLRPERQGSMAFQSAVVQKDGTSEVTIYLLPEAMIIGHVNVPGSEGDVRIECELYRRRMNAGREQWLPAGQFLTWADGEFRFSELEAGTYKLITHEQMDRESMLGIPGAPLFGYPPIYYPNTTDFSEAGAIVVHAGQTAQISLAVTRRQYYPVRIPVLNAATGGGINVDVHPMGHRSPGWSLGYNPMDRAIEGMLPDGNYTVEVDAQGEEQTTGTVNFLVSGRSAQGPPLNLIPNPSLTVNVHEEFQGDSDEAREQVTEGGAPSQAYRINVDLQPTDEFDRNGGRFGITGPGEVSGDGTWYLERVRPGRYRVNIMPSRGYVSSIQFGGVDLLKQPLVVASGAGNSPIEVTLRDDGGQVSGTVEGGGNIQFGYAYLFLMEESRPNPLSVGFQGSSFQFLQVPPGDYLALAYEEPQQDPPSVDRDALRLLQSKGQLIHVEAGQKMSVKVKMVTDGEGE